MIEFTRKKYLELYLDGQPATASGRNSNRHTTLVEAAEHATEHAVEIGVAGLYEIRIGTEVFYTVDVTEIVLGTEPPIEPPPEPTEPTIDPIPNLNLSVGERHNLLQYVTGEITNSTVINANQTVDYNHSTGQIIGVSEGTADGLTLEVTY